MRDRGRIARLRVATAAQARLLGRSRQGAKGSDPKIARDRDELADEMGEGPSALEQGECLVDIALDIEIACDVGPREAEFARRRRDSTKSVGERSTMPDRRKSRSKAARAMSEMKADEPRPEPRGRRGDSPAHLAPVARRRRAFGKPLGARSEPDDSP